MSMRVHLLMLMKIDRNVNTQARCYGEELEVGSVKSNRRRRNQKHGKVTRTRADLSSHETWLRAGLYAKLNSKLRVLTSRELLITITKRYVV